MFSYPIILFFDIFRYVLYLIIIFLKYFYKYMTKLKLSSTIFSVLKKVRRTNLVRVTSIVKAVNTSSVVITECNDTNENIDMASIVGDTLLATQKEHHRKAFDFISKALKIDEENTGKLALNRHTLVLTNTLHNHS